MGLLNLFTGFRGPPRVSPVETHFWINLIMAWAVARRFFVFCCGTAYAARLFGNNEETPCPARSAKSAKPPASAPPRAKKFCAVCCGTEREATIDCPPHCAYLLAAHRYA